MSTQAKAASCVVSWKRRTQRIEQVTEAKSFTEADLDQDTGVVGIQGKGSFEVPFDPASPTVDFFYPAKSSAGVAKSIAWVRSRLTTTLNGAINSSVETITIVAPTTAADLAMPADATLPPLTVRIDDEYLTITARPLSTTCTVRRGEHGSTAASHSNGATVRRVNSRVPWNSLTMVGATSAIPGACSYIKVEITGDDAAIPGLTYRVTFRPPTTNAAGIYAYQIEAYTSSTFLGDNETEIVVEYSGSDAVCVPGASTITLTTGPGVDIAGKELYVRNPSGSSSGPRPRSYIIASYDTGTKIATLRTGEFVEHSGTAIRWQVGLWGMRTFHDIVWVNAGATKAPLEDIIKFYEVVGTALHWRVRAFNEFGPATLWRYHDGVTGTTTAASSVAVTAAADPGKVGGTDIVFSATDIDTVSWTAGTIKLSDGSTYSIVSGNTGNMAAITYIILDLAISSTVLQITTNYANAIGARRWVFCAALNVSDATQKAAFWPAFGIGNLNATQLNIGQLSAIAADVGLLTAGVIQGVVIRTASSGARVQLDTTSGFQAIDSAENTRVQIPLTGDAITIRVNDTTPGKVNFGTLASIYCDTTQSSTLGANFTPQTDNVGQLHIGTSAKRWNVILLEGVAITFNTTLISNLLMSWIGALAAPNTFRMLGADLGSDVQGHQVEIGRNSNATKSGAPGVLMLEQADGADSYFYADNDGNLRTHSAAPTGTAATPTVDVTAGKLVGAHVMGGNMGGSAPGAAAIRWLVFYRSFYAGGESNGQIIMPFACKFSKLYIVTSTAQTAGGSMVIALSKNTIATAIIITIAAGEAAGTKSDLTNTATFAAGDAVSLHLVNNDSGDIGAGLRNFSIMMTPV